MSEIVNAKGLTKRFGDFTAVDGVSFEIQPGECFGLLGPNGAGKSTVISMIYGAASRSAGDLRVLGLDPAVDSRRIKQRLGVVTQENALDLEMNVRDNMMIFARFLGVPREERAGRVDALLDFMSLSHKAKASIRTLSGGMQRRLVFVRALLSDPDFVILDEPTTGLDPAVRQLIWAKIRELQERGKTVLLTTHYMDEAEMLCDRLVVMNEGQIKAVGTPRQLIETHCPGYVAVLKKEWKASLPADGTDLQLAEFVSGLHLRGKGLTPLSRFLEERAIEPDMIRPSNLEDAFLSITGRDLGSDA